MPPLNGTQHVAATAGGLNGGDSTLPAAGCTRSRAPKVWAGAGDETDLLRRYAETGDPALKEELVRRFLPLARSLALRYRGVERALEDLIQVASLGLVKALDGFDLERGRSFIAYAAPTILGELRRHFRDRVWEVRLPRGLQERTMAVSEAAGGAQRRARADPDGVPDRRAPGPGRRGGLGGPAGRRGASHAVARRAAKPRGPGVRADGRDGRARPSRATTRSRLSSPPRSAPLDERERRVLELRFEDDLNQYEIGRRLGVSQMQVSRIMRRALRKLLAAVQGDGKPARV